MFFFEVLLLVTALSLDAFATGVSYGMRKIEVPIAPLLVISLICSGMLTMSIVCGAWIRTMIAADITHLICFAIFLVMGIFKLFDSVIKSYIRKKNGISIKLSTSKIHLILNIYADAEIADADHSQSLSVYEAAYLAVALSLDGMAAGFGVTAAGFSILAPAIASIAITMLSITTGCRLGKKLISATSIDLSWLSGAILIFLALLKL